MGDEVCWVMGDEVCWVMGDEVRWVTTGHQVPVNCHDSCK